MGWPGPTPVIADDLLVNFGPMLGRERTEDLRSTTHRGALD